VSSEGQDGSSDPGLAETVRSARRRLSDLEQPDGGFTVVCRDTGFRPEPVRDAQFGSYEDAERARDAAGRYRDAMRTLDPSLSEYDLVVSRTAETSLEVASVRELTEKRRANGLPRSRQTVTLAGSGSDEWLRVENGPVVHLSGPDSLLDDEFVTRQLDSKLAEGMR
jgi:hypothetical protein